MFFDVLCPKFSYSYLGDVLGGGAARYRGNGHWLSGYEPTCEDDVHVHV